MSVFVDPAYPRRSRHLLVGRTREQAILRDHLVAALGGHGSVVLIGGEPGIGKSALAEGLCRDAVEQGARVLIGACYDLTETPPYGPWAELFGRDGPGAEGRSLPPVFVQRGDIGAVDSQAALFAQMHDFLAALAARQPLVLVLEDLHWADPASLDVLRILARNLSALPVLLIATYRANELTRHHPLYVLLPVLIREASAARLVLQPLPDEAIRAMVVARYALHDPDAARLVAHLHGRAEGNPFIAGELLHAMEEERLLRPSAQGWELGEIAAMRLPPLLRQVITGRVTRLGAEAHHLLTVAAVIGQEVPLSVWAAVTSGDEEALSCVVELAMTARLLDEAPDGASVRFMHALVRETLYQGMTITRRRYWHRRLGELLVANVNADPDAIAYHFRQAGDARAAAWLIKAGESAERSYAWLMAADRFEAAFSFADEGTDGRGWLLVRIARLRRFIDPRQGIAHLETAIRLAKQEMDAALAAYALYYRGFLHLSIGEIRRGLSEMEAGIAAQEALSPAAMARLKTHREILGEAFSAHQDSTALVLWLAQVGRYTEALARANDLSPSLSASAPNSKPFMYLDGILFTYADMYWGLAITYAMLGRPVEARTTFATAWDAYGAYDEYFLVGQVAISALSFVILPYETSDLAERKRLTAIAAQAMNRAEGMMRIGVSQRLDPLPVLLVEGRWSEAHQSATARRDAEGEWLSSVDAIAILGVLAYEQGERELAWTLIWEILPDGPATAPGNTSFFNALVLHRVAIALTCHGGDLDEARKWLAAYDRWLAWSGGVLGLAEGQLSWARYHRAAGDHGQAYAHAMQALTHATEPRQPLALLAAHRLLGELETDAGRYPDARAHLDAALALATACAAPYERALTLLALGAVSLAHKETTAALPLLEEARAICTALGAAPALARVDALQAHALASAPSHATDIDPLTPREVAVLRLIARGRSNHEIAGDLHMSVRTAERHVSNIYGKLQVRTRAEATAYAFRHDLT